MHQFITLLITHNAKHNNYYCLLHTSVINFIILMNSHLIPPCFGTTTVTDSAEVADSIMSSTSITCISQLTGRRKQCLIGQAMANC